MCKALHASSVLALFLALAVSLPALASSRDKGRPTQPGKYTEWNGELDELEVVETFKLGDYQRVAVGAFDVSGTPLPDAKDNTYEPVERVLADMSTPLLDGLREELPKGLSAGAAASDSAPGPGTFLIRGKVDSMDPGSKAARYWGGFGAGAARTGLSAEIADAATGPCTLRGT
ncbi:MAG TPA: DUF4410 domain-containing protein [Thermoanaerobaculia bacterium]|nr:DUF4410 domain-containing protein [Thermoanaerobaculia bacterium]